MGGSKKKITCLVDIVLQVVCEMVIRVDQSPQGFQARNKWWQAWVQVDLAPYQGFDCNDYLLYPPNHLCDSNPPPLLHCLLHWTTSWAGQSCQLHNSKPPWKASLPHQRAQCLKPGWWRCNQLRGDGSRGRLKAIPHQLCMWGYWRGFCRWSRACRYHTDLPEEDQNELRMSSIVLPWLTPPQLFQQDRQLHLSLTHQRCWNWKRMIIGWF